MNAPLRHWLTVTALAGLFALPAAAEDLPPTAAEPAQKQVGQMTQQQIQPRALTQEKQGAGQAEGLPSQAAEPAQIRSKQQQGEMKQQQVKKQLPAVDRYHGESENRHRRRDPRARHGRERLRAPTRPGQGPGGWLCRLPRAR